MDMVESIDLEKGSLLGTVTDFLQPNKPLRLVSNDKIWISTKCEPLRDWEVERAWPHGVTVMDEDAGRIWIFQDYGNHTEIIDS